MKARLEAVANVTVIMVALAVGYVVLRGWLAAPGASVSVPTRAELVNVASIDWSHYRRSLVLVLNVGCHYCRDSVPFYQRLARTHSQRDNPVQLVAVFPNDVEAVRRLMNQEGLAIRSVAEVPLETLGVVATPTVLLVDGNGRLERFWVGVLTPRQELEVLQAATGFSPVLSSRESNGKGGP